MTKRDWSTQNELWYFFSDFSILLCLDFFYLIGLFAYWIFIFVSFFLLIIACLFVFCLFFERERERQRI